ncbi:MAG: hypothetical protein ACT4P7_04750 [Gemmatimonadaceae bacterium]
MRTLAIALITAVVGGLAGGFGGEWATRAHGMSDFEGGRGMFIVFILMPAGIIAGIIVGLIVARQVGGTGVSAYAKAQGLSLALTAGLALLVSGFAVWVAPETPMIDGQFLALDLQVRMPAGRQAPRDSSTNFTILFYEPKGDHRRHAVLQFDSITVSGGREVIPGTAELNVVSRLRHVVINDGEDKHFWFDIPLRASPKSADEQWIDWWPAPGKKASNEIHGTGGFQIRYRVRRLPAET